MIVDPDFFDHWRTLMVADALGDQLAPVYIMRLWAHCQNRKADTFEIPPAGIKALCKYAGDADALESALVAAEYITRDGTLVTVVGWAEKNASLLAAWENGGKGGRPKKTHGLATGNPAVTHGQPIANPTLTQAKPIREEKIREEIQVPTVLPDSAVPNRSDPCPTQELVDLYHRRLPMLPRVSVMSESRKRAISGRWREVVNDPDIRKAKDPKTAAVEWFDWFFGYVAQSSFLAGKAKDWRADIDFLFTPAKFAKVVEGHYHKERA